jgi:hypothetical protein
MIQHLKYNDINPPPRKKLKLENDIIKTSCCHRIEKKSNRASDKTSNSDSKQKNLTPKLTEAAVTTKCILI